MPTRRRLALAAILALIFTFPLPCNADDSSKLPVWKPDPKIVAGLSPEVALDGAAFRVPETMNLTESRSIDHGHIIEWRGAPASDGIRPFFQLIEQPLDALPDSAKNDPSLNSTYLVSQFSNLIENLVSDPVTSSVEHGQIAGQPFTREYFKGYNHRWLTEIHGFLYAAVTNRAVYIFQVWDQEPMSKYSLPVYETAVQSFHPTDKPNSLFPENLIDPEDQAGQEQSDQ